MTRFCARCRLCWLLASSRIHARLFPPAPLIQTPRLTLLPDRAQRKQIGGDHNV